ncbi:hypothetical protein MJA45_11615 [Paenibacillus aurantius]|uniref:Uncharacterized protein n=1 Tax=Paenibacillus aurantius TaxID=2918900 RepID=A0AA96LGH7_9BACL|nr:hypothetical protein [Paenibacillus aurantius]WJH33180.1 hypothetical protein N6H14_23995 [Paenibacillus sp. CC-CFT747]WNQ13629.1 hypothetical protein MJA45_11615 [Paenibacillus aurantius]
MNKPCPCGRRMHIKLRTVIYQNKVEIDNVPIYCCEECSRSEVYPPVKPNLTGFIGTLGSDPGRRQYQFNEMCELADLMKKVTEKENHHLPVERILEDRINELLDLLLLAQSLSDQAWAEDIRGRLSQISSHHPAKG